MLQLMSCFPLLLFESCHFLIMFFIRNITTVTKSEHVVVDILLEFLIPTFSQNIRSEFLNCAVNLYKILDLWTSHHIQKRYKVFQPDKSIFENRIISSIICRILIEFLGFNFDIVVLNSCKLLEICKNSRFLLCHELIYFRYVESINTCALNWEWLQQKSMLKNQPT